jgi:hypothetical protein
MVGVTAARQKIAVAEMQSSVVADGCVGSGIGDSHRLSQTIAACTMHSWPRDPHITWLEGPAKPLEKLMTCAFAAGISEPNATTARAKTKTLRLLHLSRNTLVNVPTSPVLQRPGFARKTMAEND